MATPEMTPEAVALMRGRREGYATAALAAGCVAFINLFGAEKALLAIVLAGLAIGGFPAGAARSRVFGLGWLHSARNRALAAFGLGGLYIVTVIAILTLYHDKLMRVLLLLKDLG